MHLRKQSITKPINLKNVLQNGHAKERRVLQIQRWLRHRGQMKKLTHARDVIDLTTGGRTTEAVQDRKDDFEVDVLEAHELSVGGGDVSRLDEVVVAIQKWSHQKEHVSSVSDNLVTERLQRSKIDRISRTERTGSA